MFTPQNPDGLQIFSIILFAFYCLSFAKTKMNKKANNYQPAIYSYREKNRSNSDLHCYMTVNKKERKSPV